MMSLQGSIHRWSDGIGYGAFNPSERAHYNVRTPTASGRRPSSEMKARYRRHNVTAGIDTDRSDISFGRSADSVRIGVKGDPRAREATKFLTSGEVGDFCWPADRTRGGHVDKILASVSSNVSLPSAKADLSAQTFQHHERAARERVDTEGGKHEQERPSRCIECSTSRESQRFPGSDGSGSRAWRSDSSEAQSSVSSWGGRRTESCGPLSGRSCTSDQSNYSRGNGRKSGRRSTYAMSPARALDASVAGPPTSHRACGSAQQERRLRPPLITAGSQRLLQGRGQSPTLSPSSSTPRLTRYRDLDPSLDRHHKYDLIAHERAARGGEVTGRFGPVDSASVMAASLLTSELSTPWSHVLRGQKW